MNDNKIKLRSVRKNDLELIRNWRNDPYIFQFNKQHNLLNMKNQQNWFKTINIKSSDKKMFIIEKDLIPIGICGFVNINNIIHSGDIAIIIGNTKLQKKGFGSVVLKKLIEYGFKNLKLNKIGAEIFEFNLISKKFFEKFNFQHEVTYREVLWRNNRYWDIYNYSLLKFEENETD